MGLSLNVYALQAITVVCDLFEVTQGQRSRCPSTDQDMLNTLTKSAIRNIFCYRHLWPTGNGLAATGNFHFRDLVVVVGVCFSCTVAQVNEMRPPTFLDLLFHSVFLASEHQLAHYLIID